MQTSPKLDRTKPLFLSPPCPPPSLNSSQSVTLLRVVINKHALFPNRKAQVKSGAGTATAQGACTDPGLFGMALRGPGTPGLLTTAGPGGAG